MDFSLSKEQQDIAKAARKFAISEFPDRAREFDREEKFDLRLWKKACDLGFVGVFIDKKYGGLGYGFFEHCLINGGGKRGGGGGKGKEGGKASWAGNREGGGGEWFRVGFL